MLSVLSVARLGMRRRWGSLLVLALLTAAVVGLVLTLVGGARRTVSALDRLRESSEAADLFVQPNDVRSSHLDELRTHPDVEAVGQRAVAYLRIEGTEPDLANVTVAAGAVDDQYLRTVDRPRILSGTMPDPDDGDALVITEEAAQVYGLEVGSSVRIESLTPEQVDSFIFGGAPVSSFDGPRVELVVSGIVRTIDEAQGLNVDQLLFTPAFWVAQGDAIGGFDNLVVVRARDGTDLDELALDIRELWARAGDGGVQVVEVAEATTALRDLQRTQAIGLLAAAVAIAVSGGVVIAQALRRWTGDDDGVLATVGLTRAQRSLVAALPLSAGVLLGVVVAAVVAWLASRAFPTGRVAAVESSPGVRLDASLLLGGGAVAVALGAGIAAAVSFRAARRTRTSVVAGRIARAASRGPASVSAAAHLATRQDVPARPALAGAVVALSGAVAAGVFGASLDRLVEDPARDGWAWDAEVGIGDELSDDEARQAALELADRPNIGAVALARFALLTVAGEDTQIVGIEPVAGDVGLTVLTGEMADEPGEVVLGRDTALALDAGVGDTVELEGLELMSFTVSGIVRFPNVADDTPANGVAMSLPALADLMPPIGDAGPPGFPTLLVRWSPGTDAVAMQEVLGDEFLLVDGHRPSSQVLNLREVRGVAPTLVAILGLLGLAAVVHALVVSVRRARRDIGVLATVGFSRRQRAAVVVAQSVGYLGIGLLLGIPIGLVVGRWTWQLLADQLAVAGDSATPTTLALIVPVALVTALLAAVVPAIAAARLQPAAQLRAE